MHRFAPIRFAAVAGLAFSASLPAQSPHPPQAKPSASTPASSTLPATPAATPEPPPVPLTPSQRSPQPAQVTYAEGTLSVAADNASLNQILRQIASNTGMKITGGVTDERVFGQYGPADPAQVLAALLDGTGSNMILVHHDGDASSELILTPRQGGPTPPNPNAAAFADRAEKQEATQFPQSERATPQRAPNGPPITPSGSDGTPAGASPTNSSQPDNNPNGVKTPQQIYEQLQRMRQQQQQQQQTTQPQ